MGGKERAKPLAKSAAKYVAVALLSLIFLFAGSMAATMYVFSDLPSRGSVEKMVSRAISSQCSTAANATLCGEAQLAFVGNATDAFMAMRLPAGKFVASEPLLAWLLPAFGLSAEAMQPTLGDIQQLMSQLLFLSLLVVALSAAGLTLVVRNPSTILKTLGGNVFLIGAPALVMGLAAQQLLPGYIQLSVQQAQSTQLAVDAVSGIMELIMPKTGLSVLLGTVLSLAGIIIFIAGLMPGRNVKRKGEAA